ncbi:MAG: type II toxin-antitoxin system HipA family toxin [Betaproteobacteria bacterium]
MSLNVFVSGKPVAVLDSPDGFAHVLAYRAGVPTEDFVSLLMPVRTESWRWPTLHPFFQISLPEGFLLAVLKEQIGPHLGSSPLDLLAVVGANTVGRVQLSAGDKPDPGEVPFNLRSLLHGDNSPQVFLNLVRAHAASGVSGVVPKFLTPDTQSLFHKASLRTEQYIVKGSSEQLPFIALNEHLCMEVARRTGYPTPRTEVSDDGQALVVERFDTDPSSGKRLGFEDMCSLLGLSPDEKYDSTWERVARRASQFLSSGNLRQAQEQLAITLLLTYALGNADCHTKNLGLLYSSLADVRLAPIYDMLSIRVYDSYVGNPPGMAIDGRKTWTPGKALWRVLQQHMGIEPVQQRALVDKVAESMSEVIPELIRRTKQTPGFAVVGNRMVREWNDGLARIRDRTTVQVPDFEAMAKEAGLSPAALPQQHVPQRFGESPLLAPRRRR